MITVSIKIIGAVTTMVVLINTLYINLEIGEK